VLIEVSDVCSIFTRKINTVVYGKKTNEPTNKTTIGNTKNLSKNLMIFIKADFRNELIFF
jgi:hypothetical protein